MRTLVAHPEYTHVYMRHCHDDCDNLTEKGIAQANAVAREIGDIFANQEMPLVITSNQNRAKQTGQIIATHLGASLEHMAELYSPSKCYAAIAAVKQNAIFVMHKDELQTLTGRELDNGKYISQRYD